MYIHSFLCLWRVRAYQHALDLDCYGDAQVNGDRLIASHLVKLGFPLHFCPYQASMFDAAAATKAPPVLLAFTCDTFEPLPFRLLFLSS